MQELGARRQTLVLKSILAMLPTQTLALLEHGASLLEPQQKPLTLLVEKWGQVSRGCCPQVSPVAIATWPPFDSVPACCMRFGKGSSANVAQAA